VGNVGWLAPWKGQREFVEACALIAQTCPDARFVLVGAASDPRYEMYARELKIFAEEWLGDRLIWAGARPDIANVMAALDVLLHCAEREPFGRVLVEAAAMQVPVIAFRGGGPDEIVEDGQTGYLVEPHDVHAMARAATSVLANEQCRRAMGRAGRARALALFAPERNVHLIEDIYSRLIFGTLAQRRLQ
jgi:glycosyltransferase involved in cell wall biosynthesis